MPVCGFHLRRVLAAIIGAMLIGVLAPSAEAQFSPAPRPEPAAAKAEVREGLMAGLSLGFGSIAVSEESQGTLNYQVQFGGFLSHQWALAVEFWGGSGSESGLDLSNKNAGVSMQYWVGKSFWVRGAMGSASLTASIGDSLVDEFSGAAIAGGLGWEFYEHADYHFNASFGVTIEGYEDTRENVTATALQVGMQYY